MKYKIITILLIFFIFQSCEKVTNKIPENSKITTKFEVLDEYRSPNNRNCSEESVPFLQMEKYDCSFSVGEYEFDIEKKYSINETGNLIEYFKYLSEGPLSYSVKELNDDPKFKKSENLENFKIKISENRTEIFDGKNTLKIEKIFKTEKLILIIRENKIEKKGRRILYEYK